jgi:hypothetical protein
VKGTDELGEEKAVNFTSSEQLQSAQEKLGITDLL